MEKIFYKLQSLKIHLMSQKNHILELKPLKMN